MAVVRMTDLFAAAMLFAIYSLVSAALFVILDAGDVALTEAAVGAGISTILVLAVLTLVRRHEHPTRARNLPALLLVTVTGACLLYASIDMPDFGNPDNPVHRHVAPYYINESYGDMGIPNIVTSVLAGYRSIDTMGEVFVIFTAGIGVLTLLGSRRRKTSPDPDGDES